jgi:subfamily B ATP-binding cassette protein MsbA
MTAIVVVVLMIFGGGMAYTFMKLRPIFRLRWEIHAQISGRLGELFGGIRIVKGYTAEKREELLFAKGAHKLFRNIAKTITATSAVGALTRVLFGAVAVLMMVLGIRAISAGAMTAGDLVAYVALVSMVAMPMVQISNIGTQISEALAGLDRIREIRSMATEDEGDARRERIGEVLGDVAFEDVGFEYKPETPVLRGVSFDAPAGTTTALVGSSGSGKSTLIGLVMAFHRPKSGRVLIDGRDLAGLKLRDYRANLGIVMQDNFLFEGTIAENIAYAAPEAGDEQIAEAARVAHCNEFVDRFADGFQTVVGERGVKLSGGQRQRIAIARAILADPRILILDEATSSLDSESEAMIQDGLATLRRGRTTFVIAHRLSTIRSADRILVMEGGEIVERGTHEELLEADGRYRTLYDKQYQFELNRFINPGEEIAPQTA